MANAGETFFTTVGCMDGRVQRPVGDFGRQKFKTIYPDTITEAGLVGLLAQEKPDENLLSSIQKKLTISLEKHHSKGVVVHGHAECAGNPVPDDIHKDNIRATVLVISRLINQQVPVVGVFVKKENDQWVCEEV